jgi:hypothetical protein
MKRRRKRMTITMMMIKRRKRVRGSEWAQKTTNNKRKTTKILPYNYYRFRPVSATIYQLSYPVRQVLGDIIIMEENCSLKMLQV